MKAATLLGLALMLLACGCAVNRGEPERDANAAPLDVVELVEGVEPVELNIRGQEDHLHFYVAVYNADMDTAEALVADGFVPNDHREELSKSLYFEIYNSIQGYESRYLHGPLHPSTEAYYAELEDRLIALFRRFLDLGLDPSNKGDLIAAAEFREYPRLRKWLEEELEGQ